MAPIVAWNNKLETGISCVDADHKVLVSLLNQVQDCAGQHEETAVIGSVLSALLEYTVFHFSREERLQELCGYENLPAHKAAHADLTLQAKEFHRRYQDDGADGKVADEVNEFLYRWLTKHIMVEDFAFKGACQGNQAAISEAAAMPFMKVIVAGQKPIDWKKLGVLLIDDNPNFRLLVKTIFKALGVRNFKEAASAREGLEILVRAPVDAVLCDWVMEGMNGAEFARELRQFDDSSQVILVTGHAVAKYREQAAAAGINVCLQKPVTVRAMAEAVGQALKAHQTGA